MRMKNHLSALSIAAVFGFITLSAAVTHAGFQWVPPTPGAPAPAAQGEAPVPPGEAAVTPEVEQTVLPLPGEEPIPAQPGLTPNDATALNAAPPTQTLQVPPGYQAPPPAPVPAAPAPVMHQVPPPPPAPAEGNVLKVKNVTPPPSPPPAAPMPLTAGVSPPPSPPPAIQQQPLPPPAPAPVQQTKVIMPEDAPQKAMDNTPNSSKLVINPYPGKDGDMAPLAPPPAPQAAPAPAPAQQGDFATVEGFGSDQPLALAVQQIVPPGYATSFDPAINVAQRVSWDGGKPWNQIINDMIAPLKLEAVITDKVVHIRQEGTSQQSAADSAPTHQASNGSLRRGNINDPGEQSQIQAANTLAGIESAAGDAAAPATEPATSAGDIAVSAAPELPTPEQLAAENIAVQTPAATGPWEAKAGQSLKDILTSWSEKAGVELIWMAAYDYKIKQDISTDENFSQAVQAVIAGVDSESAPNLQIVQNQGSAAPTSIIIKDSQS